MLPKFSSLLSTGILAGMAWLPVQAVAQTPAPSSWKITAGPQWRQIGRLHLGPASTQGFAFFNSINNSMSTSGLPPGIYNDGFVLPDNINNGFTTTNFGWVAGTPANNFGGEGFDFTLTRIDTTTTTQTAVTGVFDGGPWTSNHVSGPGFFITLESPSAWERGGWALSMELGYSLTGMNLSRLQGLFTGMMNQTIDTTTTMDTFGNEGDLGFDPANGYTGGAGPRRPDHPDRAHRHQHDAGAGDARHRGGQRVQPLLRAGSAHALRGTAPDLPDA